MEVLAPEKRRAVRMIRDELCCMICSRVFDDPHCLDCKHNFCRECIFSYMRRTESTCPKCKLPMRPSEVTRNQFLQSILSAWIATEQALAPLEDPNSAAILDQQEQEEMEKEVAMPATASRGPVAKNKWHINTTALRQEAEAEQRRATVAAFGASLAERAAMKNAALAGGTPQQREQQQSQSSGSVAGTHSGLVDSQRSIDSQSQTQMMVNGDTSMSQPRRSAFFSPQAGSAGLSLAPSSSSSSSLASPFSLMSTQDVEGYMKKIQSQNHFLDEWAKKSATVTQFPRVTTNNKAASPPKRTVPTISAVQRVQELMATTANYLNKSAVGKRKRRIFSSNRSDDEYDEDDSNDEDYVEDGDARGGQTETQMPATAADSPDLLGLVAPTPPKRMVQQRLTPQRREEVTGQRKPVKQPRAASLVSPVRPSARLQSTTPPRTKRAAQGIVLASQPSEVVDMTGDDDDVEEEDHEEEVEVVEDSQMPMAHAAASSTLEDARKKKRTSADFQVAIQAFQERQRGSAKHRLSGGEDSVFAIAPAARDEAKKPPVSSPDQNAGNAARRGGRPLAPPGGFAFVGTDLTKEESKVVLIACQRLGGRFGRDFDLRKDANGNLTTSVTHLITKSVSTTAYADAGVGLRCKRTAKYMRALAEGTFVMDFSWVQDSLTTGRWLPEDKYEMEGDMYSDAVGTPRQSRLDRLHTGVRNTIFRKFQFVLLCPVEDFDFHIDSMRGIVVHFGGSVECADPNNSDALPEAAGRTNIGIMSKIAEPEEARRLWDLYQIPIVRVTWIFDSISHLRVQPFDDYYPY